MPLFSPHFLRTGNATILSRNDRLNGSSKRLVIKSVFPIGTRETSHELRKEFANAGELGENSTAPGCGYIETTLLWIGYGLFDETVQDDRCNASSRKCPNQGQLPSTGELILLVLSPRGIL